jgi:hypothetical protein
MNEKRLSLQIAGLVCALAFAAPGHAQVAVSFAELSGVVRDSSGAVLSKAAIGLRNVDTNVPYAASTSEHGRYTFPSLPPGAYQLTAFYDGFRTQTRNGVELRVGESATIDLTLAVAMKDQQIDVTSEEAQVEPTKTEISEVVGSRQIESLPNSGRLFTDFALTTPGVATGRTSLQSTITEFEVTRLSFGGMRDLSNEVMVDGADAINTVTGSQRATPPQDSVSEFRVVAGSFGADYGRALGGVVNIVTKSGTNNFHGSLYEFFQNNALDARSLLQPAPTPDALRQNQFGLSTGGPVKKDKTFFFANYEGQRLAQSPTFPAALTDNIAFFNAAKIALGLAPENLNILQTGNRDIGLAKLDHVFNEAHRLSVRYNVEDGRSLNLLAGNTVDGGGVAAPSSAHNAFTNDQSLAGNLTSVLRPDLVNSFLVQWARREYDFPGVTGQPTLDIPNELMFGHNFGAFDFIGESRVQLSNSTSWIRGSHMIRFGADTNFLADKVTWPGFTPMRIVLPGANCLVEFANYVNPSVNLQQNPAFGACPLPPSLNGTPIVFWATPVGPGPLTPGYTPPALSTNWHNAYLPSLTNDFNVHLNHQYVGLFAEDEWKLTNRLTVNYGLRWDVENGLGAFVAPDYRNFSPRTGIAYALDRKTVIHAGFGVFYDRFSLPFVFVTAPERPVEIPGLPGVPAGSSNAGWVLNQLTPGAGGLPADVAKRLLLTGQVPGQYISGACPPSCTAGAALIDRNSRTPYAEQASFRISREIASGLTLELGYLFVGAHHQVRAEDLNIAPPLGRLPDGKDLFAGPLYQNAGLLYYTDDSGNAAYNGLTARVARRFSHGFHFDLNYTFSKTLDDGTFTTFVSTPQDLYQRNLERANSNQDVRHRFVSDFSLNGPRGSFLRDFELTGIVTLQSGRPFTLFVGYDANGDTNPVTDRVGLSARNTYWGDALYSADLRVSRKFQLGERSKLILAVDGFNAFNRANVDEVNSVYGYADFLGPVPRNYADGIGSPANPEFGTPGTVLNPRRLQVSARITF